MNRKLVCLAALTLFAAVPAVAGTWYVDGVKGSDNNDCKSSQTACKTIGHAVSLASSGDSIKVASATYGENLTIGLSLKILGSGATTTIIDGGGSVSRTTAVTVSNANANVIVAGVTVQNGSGYGEGGGINNSGTLTINNSTISGNMVFGIMHNASGGGIYNIGKLTINESTLSGNSGDTLDAEASGGGIYSAGSLTINNSTLSGNSAYLNGFGSRAYGGGISNWGRLTINNTTISENNAASGGGGIINNPGGTVTLQNSIIANNLSGGNCSGTMSSNGYNLSSDGTCNFNNTGDLNNTDPKLGPLQNNGGTTQTQALLPGSPAIDAGNPSGCSDNRGRLLKTDQRGAPRPDKEDSGGCDMGAYERQQD